jgi:uncharacterized repeat protein (TIGR03843 family)
MSAVPRRDRRTEQCAPDRLSEQQQGVGRRASTAGAELDEAVVTEVLRRGEMEVHGRFAGSSNATLLVTCSLDGVDVLAVYKPERGERSLWDFPRGLHRREMGAFVLSEALDWRLVPTTVIRGEAPFGVGSVQRLVDDDGESHYFTILERAEHHDRLVTIAAFDVLANNADRKSGHVIWAEGRIWAIDHGLCFHEESKLRTVIWDFAGERLPETLAEDIGRLTAGGLPSELTDLLSTAESAALDRRARELLRRGTLPQPPRRGDWPPYPWPLV